MHILIVEDEEALALGLKFNFEQEGYQVSVAGDGPTALKLFQTAAPQIDLIILDLMLPGMSGYEICSAIRTNNKVVPIIILSARTMVEDRMHAFDVGTDQYMTKPFALPELLNRVRNLFERNRTLLKDNVPTVQHTSATTGIYAFDNVRVIFHAFEVEVDERTYSLTTLEMQLFRYFIEHVGEVLSRNRIMAEVWDQSADVTTRTIDNFVLRLRKIIEPDPTNPKYILSVRGTGYRFIAGKSDTI